MKRLLKLKDLCSVGSSNLAQKDLINLTGEYPIFGASGYIQNVDFYHQEKEYVAIIKDGSGVGRVVLLPAKSSVIIVVKAVLREMDIYSKREKWNTLFGEDLAVLFDKLTVLAEPEEEDEDARRFDLFMLNFMLALVHRENIYFYAGDLQNIARSLLCNIILPEIRQHEQMLRFLVSDEFEPEHLDVYFLEEVRVELRQLVRLLEKEKRKIVYSNFEDEITQTQVSEAMPTYTRSPNYLQRVECYIRENQDCLVIQKLKRNIPVTTAELQKLEELLFDGKERGTNADFEKVYGDYPLGQFIRSIVGLEVGVAKAAFGKFLKNGNLSANQIHFIDMINGFLTKEGVIAIERLYGEPFTRLHTGGIGGLFTEQETEKIIAILTHINENAVA